jgi:hypothetical protein
MSKSPGDSGAERDPQWRYIYGVHVLLTEDDEGAEVWTEPPPAKSDQPHAQGRDLPGVHVRCTEDDEGAEVWTAPLPPPSAQPPASDDTPPPDPAGKE